MLRFGPNDRHRALFGYAPGCCALDESESAALAVIMRATPTPLVQAAE